MTLVLEGTALNDEPMSRPLVGRFDERGGTLGRSDTATFTLPDPERLISRVQAQILFRDEGYWIENVSAANSTLHNGRPLSAGMRVLLREGDELRIGGYTLIAAFENDEVSATILRGRTIITQPKGATTSPKGGATSAAETPSVSSEAPNKARHAAAEAAPPEAPGDAQSPGAPPSPWSAPLPRTQSPVSDEALWRAFIEGAGIELPTTNGLSPEFLSHVGKMLRAAIEGIHRLVTMRATAKDEMRAEMTMIRVRGNNPLKFAPDATVAMQLLLEPPARGFIAGEEALLEAMVDLQSHQVGMTAGMRSALEAVLDRFDPANVEALLTTRSVFDSLRPNHHRARLWELYLEHYRSLREEAQEDFHRLFGAAFRDTYEAQVRSLEAAHTRPIPPASKGGGGAR